MTADVKTKIINIESELDDINYSLDKLKENIDVITSQLTKKQQEAILEILRNQDGE